MRIAFFLAPVVDLSMGYSLDRVAPSSVQNVTLSVIKPVCALVGQLGNIKYPLRKLELLKWKSDALTSTTGA